MDLVETVVDVVETVEGVVGHQQGEEVVDIHPDDHVHVVVIVSATGKPLDPSLATAFAGIHVVVHVPPATASMPIN